MTGDRRNMPRQLAFSLPHEAAMGREDFLESAANKAAFDLIDAWPNWPSHVVLLAGPVGAGKTHLAEIWISKCDGQRMCASDLNDQSVAVLVENGPVALEDADEQRVDQVALFHLINAIKEAGSYLLITSRSWPASWGITLPDLASRMRSATLIEVSEPDDALLRQVLVKLFSDRQLMIDSSVIEFLVTRMERSLQAAAEIVEAVDKHALSEGRAITRPVVGKVLDDFTHGRGRDEE
ncbi:MAG: DnaA/Hda family protein [Stappiaceae bacterium]